MIITPGIEKKESIADRIYKSTGISVDDILLYYPEIVK